MAKGKHESSKKTKAKTEKTKKSAAKSGAGKKAVLYAVCALALIAAAAVAVGLFAGRSSKIHPNMTLGGIEIGDMSVTEAEKALCGGGWEQLDGGSVAVTLPGGFEFTVTAAEAGLDMDCAEAAQAAYDYGHSGNPIKDLAAYFKCITGRVTAADILADANADGIRAKVNAALEDYDERMGKGYELDTEAKCLRLIKGADKIEIDADRLCGMITEVFAEGGDSLTYTADIGSASEPDFAKLHEEIFAEAVDAKYDPETRRATESTVGVDFDVEKAQKIWEAAQPGELIEIPVAVTMPKYTTEQLDAMLFADKLGSQKTSYASSASGRATNVELAAAKINGVILNPGETFSYNDVVGERTTAAGFKTAAAYSGGKVVQEVGGGICQVSSTLYCAALYANLEIVARDCHHFAVSYLPWGLDATVSWGGPEFKFKNNREFPIKIVSKCVDRQLTVEIWGTDVDGSYVEMTYSASTAYDSKYPDVAVGTRATTYRCVYDKDGNLISRTKEAGSYYYYHDEDIKWPSTPEPTQTPTPVPTQAPTPTPTEEPVPTAPVIDTDESPSLDP